MPAQEIRSAAPPASLHNCRARVLCVTSGKGGTGKSVVTSNLSVTLAYWGRRVLTVDADLGLANLHLLLGVSPRRNLYHSLTENLRFDEIALKCPSGVDLVPGPSGVTELADLSPRDLSHLVGETERASSAYDLVFIDTAAGISRMTTAFLYAAPEILLVTTPDLTAMTDAYATLKTTLRYNPAASTQVVVNRARSARQGREVFDTLDSIAAKFLGRRLSYLGYFPEDSTVRRAVAAKVPAAILEPGSAVARRARDVCRNLISPGGTEQTRSLFDVQDVQIVGKGARP